MIQKEESGEDFWARYAEAERRTTSRKGPCPAHPVPLHAIFGALGAGFPAALALAIAGVPSSRSECITISFSAIGAVAVYLIKHLAYSSWQRELVRELDQNKPQ